MPHTDPFSSMCKSKDRVNIYTMPGKMETYVLHLPGQKLFPNSLKCVRVRCIKIRSARDSSRRIRRSLSNAGRGAKTKLQAILLNLWATIFMLKNSKKLNFEPYIELNFGFTVKILLTRSSKLDPG